MAETALAGGLLDTSPPLLQRSFHSVALLPLLRFCPSIRAIRPNEKQLFTFATPDHSVSPVPLTYWPIPIIVTHTCSPGSTFWPSASAIVHPNAPLGTRFTPSRKILLT